MEFPILFKICLTPAFKMDKILESGYSNLWFYFMGKSSLYLVASGPTSHVLYTLFQNYKDWLRKDSLYTFMTYKKTKKFLDSNEQLA